MAEFSKNATENPCNMCMPMGGILAFKGIANSMVIVHGSQGCSTYMRRHIAEHFNEPIDVASSSLNEKGTVYGGEQHLKSAIDNVRRVYEPEVIGIITTCLAETIGEDIERMSIEYLTEREIAPQELSIITASTPGYGDGHMEGYYTALRRIVAQLAENKVKHNKINLIIPYLSPADIREIKRILAIMGIDYILLPDISDTLDQPYGQVYRKIPKGGTTIEDIRAMGGSAATIQIGLTVNDDLLPGKYLEEAFGIPLYKVPIPIGLANTDKFIAALATATGRPIPETLTIERGRLMDAMIDSHKYNFQGRSIIFGGDAELLYAVTATCSENGIYPVVVGTGSKAGTIRQLIGPMLSESPHETKILCDGDFQAIREAAVKAGANIAIGSSDGRYLEEKAGIPLVRIGFPVLDRVGGQRILSVGYTGTTHFLDRLTNTLLENKYKTYRRTMYDKFYKKRLAKAES